MEHCAHEGGVIQDRERRLIDFMKEGRIHKQEYCCYCGNTRWRGEEVKSSKKHGPYLWTMERTRTIVETAAWSQPCPARKEQGAETEV